MPNLTATENVELALQISKNPLKAEEVLKDVGLGHRLNNFLRSYLVGNSREFLLHVHWQRIQRSCSVMSQLVPGLSDRKIYFKIIAGYLSQERKNSGCDHT